MSDANPIGDWEESPDTFEPGSVSTEAPEPVAQEVNENAQLASNTHVDEPAEQAATEDDSADEVEAQSNEEEAEERDPKTGRYRAKKDRARPSDVGRINTLTKRLRETENQLKQLREQQQAANSPALPNLPQDIGPRPVIDDFADQEDPYTAHVLALAAYERKRERFEEKQNAYNEFMQQQQQAYAAELQNINVRHQQRLAMAAQADPTVPARLASVKDFIPPALDRAIMLDNDSASVALFLADHPAVLDEFTLLTASQQPDSVLVGKIQRMLRQRMNTAVSGSVTPSKMFVPAPRPPNPLRTAPMNTGNDQIPSDDNMSLDAHEKAFPVRGRRR